jgi:CrcB protein
VVAIVKRNMAHDPPPEDDAATPRPSFPLRPAFLGVVWVGGAVGTGARYLISQAAAPVLRVPLATAGINVVGAFLLGLLLQVLVRRGQDVGGRRMLRLVLGTGVLGGFTTYSALAVDTATLLRGGLLWHGIVYALGTVVVGGLAASAGIAAGSRA